MAKFVIGTKSGKTYTIEKDIDIVLNKQIGDVIKGELLDLPGYELEITGGSDKQGFPMRKDIVGSRRARPILTKGVGMREKGVRRRKTVRGNTISEEIIQVNLKVVKEGPKKLEEIFNKEAEGGEQTA